MVAVSPPLIETPAAPPDPPESPESPRFPRRPLKPLWEWRRTPDGQGQMVMRFHPGQLRAWQSIKRFVWALAGSQGGKTALGPLWLWRECKTRGPGDYLAVTATYPLLKLKMLPEFLRLFQYTLHLGDYHAQDRVFAFDPDAAAQHFADPRWRETPARVIFGSGINPEGLESATALAAWLDEAGQDDFRLGSWEAIQRRLMLHRGRVFAGTTLYNLGWLKQQVYDAVAAGEPDHDLIQFPSILNPAFPRAEFERMRRRLPAWKFAMFFEGRFAKPASLIYGDFSTEYRENGGHKVRRFALPAEWPRSVGLDFGAVNTALLWLAKDPETRVYYAYRELHGGTMASKEHARRAKLLSAGERIVGIYGGAKGETQQRLDWQAGGFAVREPAIWDVEAGIDKVTQLIRERRLFVFDDLTRLLEEFGTYSRETNDDGEPLETIKNKNDFHFLDALRYVASSLLRPTPRAVLAQGTARGWGI